MEASILGINTLISGDNKGMAFAACLFEERVMEDDNAADGFVVGFSQANVGEHSAQRTWSSLR